MAQKPDEKKHKKINKWIGGSKGKPGAIKRRGALTARAERRGVSVHEEAERDAHLKGSSKRIRKLRGQGLLALRFTGHAKHGNIGKHVGPRGKHRSKIVKSK